MALLEWQRPRRRSPLRRLVSEATLAEAEQLGVTGLGAPSAPGRALLVASEVQESAVEARAAARAPGRAAVAQPVVDALQPLLPPPVDHVLLQADLTAVAPGPLRARRSPASCALLADVESTGGATVYRFTEATVRRALDAGRSASDAAGAARRALAHAGAAAAGSTSSTDVARRHGAVRVGLASAYVRCDDPTTIATLLADRRTASLGLLRLADTVLAARAHAGRGAGPAA